nr:hypothetical protein [Caldimonas sp.]
MPSLNFVLPHWLYWGVLLLFPLVAMFLVARQRRHGAPREPILFNAYLFWLTAGFMGLHRMYLKSWLALLYLPFFLGVLYCNGEIRDSREDVSRTNAALEHAQAAVKHAQPSDAASATPAERDTLAAAKADEKTKQAEFEAASAVRNHWQGIASVLGGIIAVMLVIDAILIPGLVRKRRVHAAEAGYAADPIAHEPDVPPVVAEDPTLHVRTPYTDWIDRLNTKTGEFVAYWAVIAVFVYYYEVLARYVFNSPTNWVHESMFLMFG